MGAIIAAVVGAGLLAGGTAMSANSAKGKRGRLASAQDKWLPDIPGSERLFFEDLERYQPRANAMADTIGQDDLARTMRLRESALPGIGQATKDALASISPLLRGELPQGVLDAFNRSGAASTLGLGFAGSKFGALNQGLFGARGSLGAIQTGMGMLPSLLSTMPNIRTPSSMDFLSGILTPQQRVSTQMGVRGQNIGIEQALAGMQSSGDVWGGMLGGVGGMLLGGGMGGMGLGMPSGGGGAKGGGIGGAGGSSVGGWGGNMWGSGMA